MVSLTKPQAFSPTACVPCIPCLGTGPTNGNATRIILHPNELQTSVLSMDSASICRMGP